MAEQKKMTANEFVNVRDITHGLIETKDGYLIGLLRVYPYNLDLVSDAERQAKTNTLAASFQNEKHDFAYLSYPREIDLDRYNHLLKQMYDSEIASLGRKKILENMIREAAALVLSGENYEHQHYFKIWKRIDVDKTRCSMEVKTKLQDIKGRFSAVGIKTELLSDRELIRVCNLFANSQMATFEYSDQDMYQMIPVVK